MSIHMFGRFFMIEGFVVYLWPIAFVVTCLDNFWTFE